MKLFMVSACAALMVTAAKADPPTGSRLGETMGKPVTSEKATDFEIRNGHEYAGCIYTKRPSLVRQFLDARTPEEVARIEGNLSRGISCANMADGPASGARGISMPLDIYRGVLAEAVLDDSKGLDALTILPIEPTYSRAWFAVTGRNDAVDEMAVCVVDTSPALVVALLKTTPQTGDEKAAMTNLGPAFGPCLRNTATLKANRQSMRAALAEALYHRVYDPPVVAVAATEVSK